MAWFKSLRRRMFGGTPVYDGTGGGRRALAWMPSNPGAVAALSLAQDELRAKSRDLVRRNAWAAAGIEAFVANAIGTGIKPQSMVQDQATREAIHSLWWDWCEEADAAGLTDFYGLQALATRAMLEGGEALVRLRYRRTEDGLPVALQIQMLEAEHLPTTMNRDLPGGNVIRAGIEFDRLGRRVAYHLYRSHPNDGLLAPMSSSAGGGGMDTVRVDASEVIHLFRPLRPGQIRGEPWLTRALVKLNELDQYDDAELVRKKTAAMVRPGGFSFGVTNARTYKQWGRRGSGGLQSIWWSRRSGCQRSYPCCSGGHVDDATSQQTGVGRWTDQYRCVQHRRWRHDRRALWTSPLGLLNHGSVRPGWVDLCMWSTGLGLGSLDVCLHR